MLDNKDRELLSLIQDHFPMESHPFRTLGFRLGISEEEALQRTHALKDKGYIRRIGGIFDSKGLGYCSTLCAIKVQEDRIGEVAQIVNGYPGVTHNYIREHAYNMWFTLTAPSRAHINGILDEIRHRTDIDELMELPAIKLYKVKASFDMKEGNKGV